jgi:phosphoribosylformylglycinamidine synthase
VGVVGLVEDMGQINPSAAFRKAGHTVAILGEPAGETLGGSEYIYSCHGLTRGMPPRCRLDREKAVSAACRTLVQQNTVASAHDLSDGGLFVALAECTGCHNETRVGAHLNLQSSEELTTALFGEAGARIIVSYAPENTAAVQQVATTFGVTLTELGTTGGESLNLSVSGTLLSVGVDTLFERWDNGLTQALGINS